MIRSSAGYPHMSDELKELIPHGIIPKPAHKGLDTTSHLVYSTKTVDSDNKGIRKSL